MSVLCLTCLVFACGPYLVPFYVLLCVFQLLSIFHLDAFLSDSDFYWPGVLEGRFGKREKEEKENDLFGRKLGIRFGSFASLWFSFALL